MKGRGYRESPAYRPVPSYVIPETEYGVPIFRRLVRATADALTDKEKRRLR